MSLSTTSNRPSVSPPLSITKGRVEYLDGWRGLAILAVLLGHFTNILALGELGVELFFVLSGRLMADLLFVKRVKATTFLVRRVSRVYPALLVFVAATFPLALVAGSRLSNGGRPVAEGIDAAAALTFTTNYLASFWHHLSIYSHTWSLAVEEHAYILLLGVAALVMRDRQKAAVLLWLASLLCFANGLNQNVHPHDQIAVYWQTDVRVASIFLSAALFLTLQQVRWLRGGSWIVLVSPLCLIVLLAFYLSGAPEELRYTVGTLVAALAINFLDVSLPFMRECLETRTITLCGALSYSLYLWQQPFWLVSNKLPAFLAPVVLAALLTVAYASFRIIETPARRAINAAWDRHQARFS
jgi:peptidoglycan/LPS O-acetylase OafA/YrhL